MILESISKTEELSYLPGYVKDAIEEIRCFLKEPYVTGRRPLGSGMTLISCEYETKPLTSDSRMEAHQKYIDLMYMVNGEEIIYVKDTDELCHVTRPYDPEIEALLADVDKDSSAIRLTAGRFILLFPQDAHCPSCCETVPCKVRKIIVKIPV